MSLLFCDSFDHYVTANILTKWPGSSIANLVLSSGAARFGAAGFSHLDNSGGGYLETTILPVGDVHFIGFAYRPDNVGGSGTILGMRDGGSAQWELGQDASHHLYVSRNGTVLGTATSVLSNSVWYYVEVKVTIHNSSGTVDIRLNGVSDLSLTGQDTQNTANAFADTLRLGKNGNSCQWQFDDLYVCDDAGSAPTNTFLGDVRVEAILPSGNGNSSVLVGSDSNSTDNYLLVDEASPNSDTDYVESSTVGDKDTYAMGNVTPTTGTVYGVQVIPFAKKTDAGTRSIVSVARLSGTEVDSAVKVLSTSYQYLPDIREAKPGGGVWSITDVNNAEFGVKVNA